MTVSTIREIEQAIARLSKDELARFRAWFDEFDAAAWDKQIESDARSGKLKKMAEQALEDYRTGNTKEL